MVEEEQVLFDTAETELTLKADVQITGYKNDMEKDVSLDTKEIGWCFNNQEVITNNKERDWSW